MRLVRIFSLLLALVALGSSPVDAQRLRAGLSPGFAPGLRFLGTLAPAPAAVPNLWLDSDLGPDTDDRDTFLLLADAHRRGIVNIVGMSSSTIEGSSGAGIREFIKFSGLPASILVGVNKNQGDRSSTSFIQAFRVRFAADETSNDSTDAGYIALRKGLAASIGKLTILTIGGADNIAQLLQSPGDTISPLTGAELVAAKCDRYISMLGDYDPATGSGSGEEYNVALNRAAAAYVSDNWPASVPLEWIGTIWGDVIHVAPDGRMVGDDWRNAAAMAFTPGPNKSYDLGTFYLVTGQAAGWLEKGADDGKMTVSASTGVLSWSSSNHQGQSYYRWKAGVDRSETGPVATKLNSDLAALVPPSTFVVPQPLVDMDFVSQTYSGANLADLVCNGAAGRTALNADGSTATFGANVCRRTDQGLYLDGSGSDTIRFAGALLAAFDKTAERSVLVITDKADLPDGDFRLLGASSGFILAGGRTNLSSWSGSFGGNGNLPSVNLPAGASWANVTKSLISWNATSRRLFVDGATASEIVGKGFNDLTNVYLGHNAGGGERFTGFVRRIIVYDRAMPFTNGMALTAP